MDNTLLDKETRQILTDGEKIERFTESDGWKLVKQKLISKLAILNSISSVPKEMERDKLLREYELREGVISIILDWIRDIEGEKNKSKFNKQTFEEIKQEIIIHYSNE